MTTIASQITSLAIVYSIVYSGADQRKHQSFASLAFVRGIHRWPVNSPRKWPVTRKMFPFDDVIMTMVRHHIITYTNADSLSIGPVQIHLNVNLIRFSKLIYFHLMEWFCCALFCYGHIVASDMMTSSNGTISALLSLCAGISPVTGEFPAQRPVTRSSDVFFDLLLNKRLSKQWWGWWFETPSRPSWRHCYDLSWSYTCFNWHWDNRIITPV